jgi:hypothetical protein
MRVPSASAASRRNSRQPIPAWQRRRAGFWTTIVRRLPCVIPQLRNRLEEARRIMSDRSLDRRLFARVRRMARLDRDELRARVAQRDQNRAERREDRQNARQLLNDPRSASQPERQAVAGPYHLGPGSC